MKKKIYIAGKVTGLNPKEVHLKFKTAEEELTARGFESVNPITLVNNWHATWEDAMKKCIAALVMVDGVYLLPCCDNSPGARWEIDIAARLKIPTFKKVDEVYQLIIITEQL